jgi:hypothetical protein
MEDIVWDTIKAKYKIGTFVQGTVVGWALPTIYVLRNFSIINICNQLVIKPLELADIQMAKIARSCGWWAVPTLQLTLLNFQLSTFNFQLTKNARPSRH